MILQDSLQRNDRPDYQGLLQLFPQNYHEPYYASYTKEDFAALASECGLVHVRSVMAFVSKVMVFDKAATPARGHTGPSERPRGRSLTQSIDVRVGAHRGLNSEVITNFRGTFARHKKS